MPKRAGKKKRVMSKAASKRTKDYLTDTRYSKKRGRMVAGAAGRDG